MPKDTDNARYFPILAAPGAPWKRDEILFTLPREIFFPSWATVEIAIGSKTSHVGCWKEREGSLGMSMRIAPRNARW